MNVRRKNSYGSISEAVYQKVFDRIVCGKLRPGQKITEQQLAQSEGVSRAPVREAFTRLAADRLLVLVPRSGCYIYKLTGKDIRELFGIRQRLEELAMEFAFARFNLERVRDLRRKFAACLKLSGGRFVKEELKLDSKFHALIFDTADSPCLQDMLENVLARIQIFRMQSSYARGNIGVALKTHLEILDAILAGDRRRAMEILRRHIDISRENALRGLRMMEPGARKKTAAAGVKVARKRG